MTMDNKIVTIPKGTVVKLDGIPCELVEDTQVISGHYFEKAMIIKDGEIVHPSAEIRGE